MASRADHRSVRLGRLYRTGIIGVARLWPVANFAVQSRMPAQLLLIDYIGMATFANLVPCMGNRARRHFSDRIATIMAVLAERFGNHGGAQYCEGHERYNHDRRKSKKVLDVLEQDLTLGVQVARRYSKRCQSAMVFDTGKPAAQR